MDEYAAQSKDRTHAAQKAGKFDDEIVNVNGGDGFGLTQNFIHVDGFYF
ncbi:MAG: hypothetical protein V3U57_07605 [Robiginitomaculum sp.]